MTKNEIVEIAMKIKKTHKNIEPFKIAKILGIKLDFFSFRKSAIQAYILKPDDNISPCICINSNFDKRSQQIFCAHELGHAVLHKNPCNHFNGDSMNTSYEYEANLFAVALLFDEKLFNIKFTDMDNYLLKGVLDYNITY